MTFEAFCALSLKDQQKHLNEQVTDGKTIMGVCIAYSNEWGVNRHMIRGVIGPKHYPKQARRLVLSDRDNHPNDDGGLLVRLD